MLHAFLLFADPANSGMPAAISPWSSFLIIMLAFGGALIASRAKNDLLMVAFAGVGLLFGAVAADATQKALSANGAQVQTLQASLASVRDEQATYQALRENLQLERDSMNLAVEQLRSRVEELERRPVKTRVRTVRAATKPAVAKPAVKKQTVSPGLAQANTAPAPQTYAAPDDRLRPQTATRYKYVGEFRYGLAPVKGLNNKWGYIAETGDVVVAPFLKAACTLHAGLGGVKNDAGRWGYVDRFGKVVIPYLYTEALAFEEDSQQALVQLDGNWSWINTKGQVMRPAKGSELRARKRIPVIAAR